MSLLRDDPPNRACTAFKAAWLACRPWAQVLRGIVAVGVEGMDSTG
jgi:hypothetical protein